MTGVATRFRQYWPLLLGVIVLTIALAAGFVLRKVYPSHGMAVTFPVASDTSTPQPTEQPGPATVQFSADAKDHPHASAINQLLTSYFDAINNQNFDQWRGAVTVKVWQETSKATWQEDYESTKDGSILVNRIINGPNDTLRIMLSFTSTQDVAKAPPDLPESCIRWRVVYPVAWEGRTLRIDKGSPLNAIKEKC